VFLALRYNGEVINGDAMQLYSGLPIITNKITVEERKGVPHHLLGCIDFGEPTWVVGTFVKRALRVIEEIRSRGKLPILVGGTHYYTQSLLFRDRLAETEQDGKDDEEKKYEDSGPLDNLEETYPILKEPTDKLLEKLQEIDPVMAARWHPNDRRKIQRSIEIYLQTGRKASDIYAEQRLASASGANSSNDESDLRFPTLLFWIHAETETLRTRLDNRVDKMLSQGLLDEVTQLHKYATEQCQSGQPVDESRGIWVSIGFKEFKAYITALQSGTASETDLQVLKDEAIERTKIATRQYAKRQTRWIRLKLLQAVQSQAPKSQEESLETGAVLYLLDGTSVPDFQKNVFTPTEDITQAFLSDSPMPDPTSLSAAAAEQLSVKQDQDALKTPQSWVRRQCDLCGVTCVTEKQWEAHARSRAHRRLVSKKRKLEEEEEVGEANIEKKAEPDSGAFSRERPKAEETLRSIA
jgi:tRNA dimethylallyltransferase